ncbi:hypothetical protein [Natronococcus wangiae]|uniref:hypothetical protein n=1 Tax=Natronococcus wangiae TaxID=3068275 RepID=UPI00273EB006|nr:hypothetical protein [Natronococcus sp. AD5]
MAKSYKPRITARERAQLATQFDIERPVVESESTLDELRDAVDAETNSSFAKMGEAVRNDLTGTLEDDTVESALVGLEDTFNRAKAVREARVPVRYGPGDEGIEELYRELIAPIWDAYDHLVDVGFFESLEENLPAFTPEHIDHTAREVLQSGKLIDELADCGFDDHERTALLLAVVDNNTRLSRWVPTRDIPDGVEFNVDYVPPLYHRAVGGGLLWIKALDRHLVQKEILLTEAILDDAFWRTKAILGGVYLFLRAVRDIATADGELTDEQLIAALSAGAAITIVNQEELMREVFWLHEEKRAPSATR